MLSLRKIAVTGGISSGKSTVCQILKEEGAYVVDADEITHKLLSLETEVGKRVLNLLGREIITENQIDRKKIANIVFSDLDKLQALEQMIHPYVRQMIKAEYEKIKDSKEYCCFVAEVPLLYEAHMQKDFDDVIAVIGREPKTEALAARMERQLPSGIKALMADFVINNNEDLPALRSQVKNLLRRINENG